MASAPAETAKTLTPFLCTRFLSKVGRGRSWLRIRLRGVSAYHAWKVCDQGQSVMLTLSPAILHQTIAVAQSTRAWNDISNMYCTLALRPWTARTQDSVRILLRPRLVMSKMSISYLVCFRGGVADPATLRMHHRFSLLCVSFCILSCWGGWSSHPNMKIIDFHCFLLHFVCFRVGVVDPATLAHISPEEHINITWEF